MVGLLLAFPAHWEVPTPSSCAPLTLPRKIQMSSISSIFLPVTLHLSVPSRFDNMFFPLGWALNPAIVPSFVPSSANMQQRRPSIPRNRNSLPHYTVTDRNAPPAYPLGDLPGSPVRPKKAHTHLPHNETRAGASRPSLSDDYVHMQNGLNFDVEANMAAATV